MPATRKSSSTTSVLINACTPVFNRCRRLCRQPHFKVTAGTGEHIQRSTCPAHNPADQGQADAAAHPRPRVLRRVAVQHYLVNLVGGDAGPVVPDGNEDAVRV